MCVRSVKALWLAARHVTGRSPVQAHTHKLRRTVSRTKWVPSQEVLMQRVGTKFIAIHVSATRPSDNTTAADIDAMHKAKGWKGIGYNYFIQRDGTTEQGREPDEQGAHVSGYNDIALGICMAGGVKEDGVTPENNMTEAQWKNLEYLVGRRLMAYTSAVVQGHRDFPQVAKECPCFDAIKWAYDLGYPTPQGLKAEPHPERWKTK